MKRCVIQSELKTIIAAFVMTDVIDTNSMVFPHIPIAMFTHKRERERERDDVIVVRAMKHKVNKELLVKHSGALKLPCFYQGLERDRR